MGYNWRGFITNTRKEIKTMKLYHGSETAGIKELLPQTSNHEKPLAYLTDNRALAVVYSHNYLPRPLGFFTYCWGKNHSLHYEEYFPGQIELFYKGKKGCVYTAEIDGLTQIEKMPWVYVSETPVKVSSVEEIPDIYEELLRLHEAGEITLHFYEDLPHEYIASSEKIVKREIENLKTNKNEIYENFLREHFPQLFGENE